MVLLILFVVYTVVKTVSEGTPTVVKESFSEIDQNRCGDAGDRIDQLLTSDHPSLRKLSEIENKCGSYATNQLMIFVTMPKDTQVAKKLASNLATQLKEFHTHGLKPIVIVEPSSEEWGLIDFSEFVSGFFNSWIEDFFIELKAEGITDEVMGTWVPFPEANLPYWNHQNSTPSEFAKAINNYAGILKKYYPKTDVSILLNSATYATDDYNWEEGEYTSLVQYVEGINKEYISSFGIQGFPWMPGASTPGKGILEPAEFLALPLAKEAADVLGTKNIWINTGTFVTKYAQTPEDKVIVPAEIRKDILNKIVDEAVRLQKSGYNVTINIFAEDKSLTPEETDWSYWASEATGNTAHQVAFIQFLRDLYKNGIQTSFYLK